MYTLQGTKVPREPLLLNDVSPNGETLYFIKKKD